LAVIKILKPRSHDLGGGMIVRRSLPAPDQRSIGPFVFFDHFGPIEVKPENNFDVRPHPHIGLATVTYLFDGAIVHRDSLANTQRIEPGALNWMTAGRGVVHSERRPKDLQARVHVLHGLQLWAALPRQDEEVEPAFIHTPAHLIPTCDRDGVSARVLIGSAFGLHSPVSTYSETLYLDILAGSGAILSLPPTSGECAIYGVDKPLIVDGLGIESGTLAILSASATAQVSCPDGAHYVVIGGEPVDGDRHIWWNFVSSRQERIEQAKADWTARRMGEILGETERIPLPG